MIQELLPFEGFLVYFDLAGLNLSPGAGARCDYTSLREGVYFYLYTKTPSRIANKLRGECSYLTPIRVVLSTKKLSR
jgi:hypothetical protein